jgi:HD-GYP domain-containing protein (c-di-GMP phosphodiesterase class II)
MNNVSAVSERERSKKLEQIAQAVSSLGREPARDSLDRLGESLRDFTIGGASLPRSLQHQLEEILNGITEPSMSCSGIVRGYITLALHARHELRRDDAIRLALRALKWALNSQDCVLLARAHKFLAVFHAEAGRIVPAMHYALEGLAALSSCDEKWHEVELLSTVANVLIWSGQSRLALRVNERALAVAATCDVPLYDVSVVHNNMALCYLIQGDYRRGLTSALKGLELRREGRAAGYIVDSELGRYYAARLFMETGQLVEAGQCLADVPAGGEGLYRPLIRLAEGMLLVLEGKTEEGLAAVEEAAEDQIRRTPFTGFIEPMLAAARAYELAGDADGARKRIAAAIDHALSLRQAGSPADMAEVRCILGEERDNTLQLMVDRRQMTMVSDIAAATRRKLQNIAVLAEMAEAPCARHAFRVGRLSYLLALRIGMPESEARAMSFAGRLHDIGKIGVPGQLLAKAFELTEIETEAVRTHCKNGEDILRGHDGWEYRAASAAARSHHERWDGSGYPDGKVGEEIPLAARIVALAEAFDAMTHDRPWRRAMTVVSALETMRREAGRQFDPALALLFIECVHEAQRDHGDLEAFLSEEAQGSDFVELQERLDAALCNVAIS